jgi:hypothetical protein
MLVSGHQVNMLVRPCNWLGDVLSRAHFQFSGAAARVRDKLALPYEPFAPSETFNPPAPPDGPTAYGGFSWKGKENGYTFSRRQWQLLEVLWRRGPVEEEQIHKTLQLNSNALWQLQHKTQKKLDTYRLPFTIMRPRPLYLQLKRRPLIKR